MLLLSQVLRGVVLITRMAERRVNSINRRREFFRATPVEANAHLGELAGELLAYQDIAEALEYRQSISNDVNVDAPASVA